MKTVRGNLMKIVSAGIDKTRAVMRKTLRTHYARTCTRTLLVPTLWHSHIQACQKQKIFKIESAFGRTAQRGGYRLWSNRPKKRMSSGTETRHRSREINLPCVSLRTFWFSSPAHSLIRTDEPAPDHRHTLGPKCVACILLHELRHADPGVLEKPMRRRTARPLILNTERLSRHKGAASSSQHAQLDLLGGPFGTRYGVKSESLGWL